MKKVKILTIVLAIILITMISFVGVYVNVQNRMENKVKGYSYAMDIKGARVIRLKKSEGTKTIVKDSEGNQVEDAENLTDEELNEKGYTKENIPENAENILSIENYKKSKEIIENRLQKINEETNKINKQFNLEENNFNYNIALEESTGDILIEIPENDYTDSIVSNIGTVGKFEIIDSETKEVLMTNEDIKTSNILYGSSSSTSSSGTLVYLNIEFTKDGAKKLEDISNKYVKTTENAGDSQENLDENSESTENTENNETTTEKKITMKIDDEEIMSTSFDETLRTGKLQLSVGTASTDSKIVKGYADQASNMAIVLDVGNMPIKYNVEENKYVLSDITSNILKIVEYSIIAISVIALIVLVVKYRLSGLLGVFSFIGLASIFSLIIRYTNVILSLEGIFAIGLVLILNYIFVNKFLSKLRKSENSVWNVTKETYKEYFIKLVPVIIAIVAFCFVNWSPISSFGMVMFWGIVLIAIYNVIITSSLLSIKAKN